MPKQINSSDLDQIVNVYRAKLRQVGGLWSQLIQFGGHCDLNLMTTAHDLMEQLEETSMHLLEEQVFVETARYHVRNLKQMLDVSRQIVDAKSLHLKTEEQQIERERNVRYKEFQKIHKIQEEKAVIEKNLVPAREKMSALLETLSRKCIKQKYLEEFASCLTEELSKDLDDIKAQTQQAREERSIWDRFDVDVLKELKRFIPDENGMKSLRSQVLQLKENFKNQNTWYEEELRTKLVYSSRNREIQNKVTSLNTILKRMERSGRHEDWGETKDSRTSNLNDFSTTAMIDGVPDIQAKDVEDFLSHQFGVRVLADYSMLRRLKDEIGVLGLAYLVERIRFQDHFPCTSKHKTNRTFKDLEEKQIELALETIAKEYRTQEESGWQSWMLRHNDDQIDNDILSLEKTRSGTGNARRRLDAVEDVSVSPSGLSTPTGSGTVDFVGGGPNNNSSVCSSGSLKSKSSMSRIKKIFKF